MNENKLNGTVLITILNCYLSYKAAYRKNEMSRILSEAAIIEGTEALIGHGVLNRNKSGAISVNKDITKRYKKLMDQTRLCSLREGDITELNRQRLHFPADQIIARLELLKK